MYRFSHDFYSFLRRAVTHIVTEFDIREQVAANVGVEVLDDNIEVVNTRWLSECIKEGQIVEVNPVYRSKARTTQKVF